MTQARDIRVVFGYIVDDASVTKAIAASKALTGTIQDARLASVAAVAADVTAKEAAAKGTTAVTIAQVQLNAALEQSARSQAFTKLAQDAAKGAVSIDALTLRLAALGATDFEIKQLVADMERLQAAQSGGGGGLAGGLRNVRAGLIALPGVGFQSPIVFAARGAELAVTQLGLGAAALGVLGVAAAGLVLVFKGVTDETARITAVTKARLEVEDQVRQKVEEATRLEAIEQRNQAQKDLNDAQARLQELQNTQLPVTGDLLLGQITRGLLGGGELKTYNEEIEKQKIAIASAQTAISEWNRLIGENATLTNDQIADAQKEIEIQSLTKAQRQARIAEDERNIAILRDVAENGNLTGDAFNNLLAKIGVLRDDVDDLNEVMTTYADLLEREKQARDNAKTAGQDLLDAISREVEARQALYEIEQKQTEATAEAASKLQDALDDANLKRANAEADAEDRRSQIADDAAERRAEIEQDDADRRAEILKKFNTDYFNAVADRDALAAFKAKQTRDDDLSKQDKALRKQEEALDKSMAKQLASVQKALDKQLRSIQDGYDRQVREIGQALAKQLKALEGEKAQEQANLENSIQAQLTLQRNYYSLVQQAQALHNAIVYKTIYDYGEMTRVYLQNLWAQIAAGARNLSGSVGGGTGSGPIPGGLSAGSAFPPLSTTIGNLGIIGGAPGRGPLPGSRATNRSAVFAPAVTINAANMSPAQMERTVTAIIVKSAKKVGFR